MVTGGKGRQRGLWLRGLRGLGMLQKRVDIFILTLISQLKFPLFSTGPNLFDRMFSTAIASRSFAS